MWVGERRLLCVNFDGSGECKYVGESGHGPDTFSFNVIYSATIQVRRTGNAVVVGPICDLYNYRMIASELT